MREDSEHARRVPGSETSPEIGETSTITIGSLRQFFCRTFAHRARAALLAAMIRRSCLPRPRTAVSLISENVIPTVQ